MTPNDKLATIRTQKGWVHCPICTHTVEADVLQRGRQTLTRPGQKCPRCASSLDAAFILRFEKAA